ncbi:SRPBCC domain-containing protein [Saccharopolyspora taberi]|uniref:SRPBCC family protein n=1 Tax=Saccharopolyspora taberi TaxID=60895 RepID=A0ABN3V5G7_9PSEU
MVADRVEREIVIAAPVERVWAALLEPGFWLGEADAERVLVREGARLVSEHHEYGSFPQRIERVEPQRHLAYRWANAFPGAEPVAGNSTRVELSLTPEGTSTRLRLVESGFAALDLPEQGRRQAWDDNTEAWAMVLDDLRRHVQRPTSWEP